MLSERIRYHRRALLLTQEQLSTRAKITHATIIKLESGANANPTLKTLRALARALQVPIAKLLT